MKKSILLFIVTRTVQKPVYVRIQINKWAVVLVRLIQMKVAGGFHIYSKSIQIDRVDLIH